MLWMLCAFWMKWTDCFQSAHCQLWNERTLRVECKCEYAGVTVSVSNAINNLTFCHWQSTNTHTHHHKTPYSVWFSLCHAHSSVHSSAVEKSSGRERAVSVENGMCMFSCRPLSVMLLHYSLLVRVVIISSFLVQWVGTKWIKRKATWKKTKEKWNTLHIKKIKTTHSRFSCKANKHQVHLERSIVFYCLKIKRWKKGFDNQAQTISFESVFV